jgi:hypothetical protein
MKPRTATTIAKTTRTAWGVLSMSNALLVLRPPFLRRLPRAHGNGRAAGLLSEVLKQRIAENAPSRHFDE